VAAAALCLGPEAFAGGAVRRLPMGDVIIVDELPRGVACRAYGDRDPDRPEWLPVSKWQGHSTYVPSKQLQHDDNRAWWHFNAEGKKCSTLARQIRAKLLGVDNPLIYPTVDVGSFVVVTNCEKVRVPGQQYHYKLYIRNLSRRPGHCKVERFKDLQQRFPERIIMKSVWGCMPKTPKCRRIFKERLKLFTGPNHLYYDKDIIDFPMWHLPDCTWETNLRHNDRLRKWIKQLGPKVLKTMKEKEEKQQISTLAEFKNYLRAGLEESGEEAAKDMSVEEFVEDIARRKAAEVRAENEGLPIPRKVVRYYPNTNIPIQKVRRSDNQRTVGYWLRRYR
jgi:large subunit ribosomal protein L13